MSNGSKKVDITVNINDLHQKLHDLKRELFGLRFQKVTGNLTNTSQMRNLRANIARINTELVIRKKGAK